MKDNRILLTVISIVIAFIAGFAACMLLPETIQPGVFVAVGVFCGLVARNFLNRHSK